MLTHADTPKRTPEEIAKLKDELQQPYEFDTPQRGGQILRILDCDEFSAHLYFNPPKPEDLTFQLVPPQQLFDRVYKSFCLDQLTTSPKHGRGRGRRPLPKEGFLKYNGHPIPFRLFDDVIYEFGLRFAEGIDNREWHRTIDWVQIAGSIGHPFVLNPQFPVYLRDHYFTYVAPIVDLWISAVHQEIQRHAVADEFTEIPHSNPDTQPSEAAMRTLLDAMKNLGSKLRGDLTLQEANIASLSMTSFDVDAIESMLLKISSTQKLRAVARLLPSQLAALLMNITQWYLNLKTEGSLERGGIIKLLQNTSFYSNSLPNYMFIDGFEANGEEMTGTEAVVRMGKIKDQKVAVRWPTQLPFRNGKQRLDVHKRYLRALVVLFQIKHENIVELLGITNAGKPVKPSIAMVYLPFTLSRYSFRAAKGDWHPYANTVKGIMRGVEYLHSHFVVHGDLHWSNVLVDSNGSPKIADFGFSRLLHLEANSQTTDRYASGSENFRAFEITDVATGGLKQRPGLESDVFACGMLLLCLALPEGDQSPYSVLDTFGRFARARKGTGTEPPPPEPAYFGGMEGAMAQGVRDLMDEMTALKIETRPKARQVRERLEDLFGAN